jgi:hypothetical protein
MITEAQKERLYQCARDAEALGDAMLKSWSGADQADSEVYFCERRVYIAVADGQSIEAAIVLEDRRWRKYAAEQAPKIKRGPSSGQSVISHRWVDPDKFASRAIHIRAMARRALIGQARDEAAQ